MTKKYFKIYLICLALILPTSFLQAASVWWRFSPTIIDKQIVATLWFDAGSEKINSITGQVSFDQNVLHLKNLSLAGSLINLWLKEPQEQNGQIDFAGITPGGFTGRGAIFSLVLTPAMIGNSSVKLPVNLPLNDFNALLNNGIGATTKIAIRTSQIDLTPIELRNLLGKNHDQTPPEPFTAQIVRDPLLADGQAFLIFNTEDKGSGLLGYDSAEFWLKPNIKQNPFLFNQQTAWAPAVSPYEFKNKLLVKYVVIRAVDMAGNVRLVLVPPAHLPISFWLVFAFFLIASVFIFKKKWMN